MLSSVLLLSAWRYAGHYNAQTLSAIAPLMHGGKYVQQLCAPLDWHHDLIWHIRSMMLWICPTQAVFACRGLSIMPRYDITLWLPMHHSPLVCLCFISGWLLVCWLLPWTTLAGTLLGLWQRTSLTSLGVCIVPTAVGGPGAGLYSHLVSVLQGPELDICRCTHACSRLQVIGMNRSLRHFLV